MPDEKYWRGRFVQVEQTAHKQAQETLQALDAQYRVAERDIERQMSTWYQRFAANNGIDLREAKRLLNSGELKEFKWSVQDYIKYGREHALNGQWMKELENASARFHVTRLQALQLDCQQTIERLYGGRLDALDALMKDQYLGGYLHTAFEIQRGIGIGWDIAAIDARALQRVISKPWTMDGKNFSERIWASKAALTSEVQKQLTQNLMLGRAPDQSIKAIADAFNVSRGQSARLVMTESAYFASLSQQDCFNALGVELYQIVATLDERTSETCQAMDGQVFSMKDYSPGTTAPPFHPWCRTVTCPYYADMKGVGERAARDPETGKTYHVPRDMKYGDWKKTFAEGGTKEGLPVVSENGTIKGIGACKTVAEVEKFMREQGWFRVGSIDQNQRVSLTGCDLECAQEIARAYERVFDQYPFLKGRIDAVSVKTLSGGTYAQCWTTGGGAVEVNSLYYGDHLKIQRMVARDIASGYHPAGTDWRSVVVHEIGHALDGTLTNMGLAGAKSAYSYQSKDVSAMLRPKVMKACGLKVSAAYSEVSGYATKNACEWFAECFCELVDSPTPRRVAVEFGKQLAELLLKVKVK